jgi:drug/metabolite transporter (DMT)-like permease
MTARVAVNLAVVYLVWGSTYLAIDIMVRTIPPLYAMGIRFLVAGALLALWLGVRRRGSWPARAELAGATVTGALMLGAAYGLLAVAQRTVPSGLAAVLIASVPMWGIGFRAAYHEAVPRTALVGVVLGLGGVALVALPSGGGGTVAVIGIVLLLLAALAEAAGAFYTPRLPQPQNLLTTACVQLLVAGVLLTVTAAAIGEPFQPGHWSTASWLGMLYLIGPGSLLAYAALLWLLNHVPLWLATSYAYVNPAVALLLGWAVLREPLSLITITGSALIVAAVVLIARHQPEAA